jgi:hypothetical protein
VITPRKGGGLKTSRRWSMFTGGEWVRTDERAEIRSLCHQGPSDRPATVIVDGKPEQKR